MLLVDRYGGAIEYDLHARLGLDLLDFFRGTYSWRKLLGMLDRLPSGSAYWAARLDDDAAAAELAALHKAQGVEDKPAPSAPPALAEMELSNQLLMELVDGVSAAVDRLERLGGASGDPPKPMPRPLTARARLAARREHTQYTDLVAEARAAQARQAKIGGDTS